MTGVIGLQKSHIMQPQSINGGESQVKSADPVSIYNVPQPVQQTSEAQSVSETQTQTIDNASSNQTFYGYTIDELRKYLEAGYSVKNLLPKELIDKANEVLTEEMKMLNSPSFLTEEQRLILDKIFPDNDGLEKAVIESYFNACTITHVLDVILNENDTTNMNADELHELYRKGCRSCNEFCQDPTTSSETKEIIKTLRKANYESKVTIIKQLILSALLTPVDVPDDFIGPLPLNNEAAIAKFREIQNAIGPEDKEIRKALFKAIGELDEAKQAGLAASLLEDCQDDTERAELLLSIDLDTMTNCSKDLFMYIVNQYNAGGMIAKYMLEKGITSDKIAKIQEALKGVGEGKPFVIDDELKEIFEIYKDIINGLANIAAASGKRDDLTPEDLEEIGNTIGGTASIINEDGIREIWNRVHEIYEQNPDGFGHLTPEQFEEIMNRISNGNYGIVVEDILRGDGVHSPLNMPSGSQGSNSGSQSYNSGAYETGASAQNPETGFFNTQPQSFIYNTQNNLAQLKAQVAQATTHETLPQLVKPSASLESAIASGEKISTAVNEHIRENGVTSFVREAFNSKVAMKCSYVKDKALNYFENMGTGLKRITFESIHNTANAIMAARTMSATELEDVHAQNIYLAENIEQIEEEKKKQQQGCV